MLRSFASPQFCRTVIAVVAILFTSVAPGGLAQAQQPAPEATPRIAIAHFAPFSDTMQRSYVGAGIDGQPIGDAFPYLSVITDIELSPGTHELALRPVDWPGKVVTETIPAVADMDVIYALIGGTAAVPLQLVSYPNETTGDPNNGKLRLHNFAPVAFDGDTEISLCNEDGEPFLGVENVRFPDSSAYVTATPGIYILHIAPTGKGCQDPVTDDFEVVLGTGQIVDLYFNGLTNSTVFPLSVAQYDQGLHRRWPHNAYLPTILAVSP